MKKWSEKDILDADEKMSEVGVPFHCRAESAAKMILGPVYGNFPTELEQEIASDYRKLFPEYSLSWPGMGTGFINSLDRVKKVALPIPFGTVTFKPHSICGFHSEQELRDFCRNRDDIFNHVSAQSIVVLLANNVQPSAIKSDTARFFWQKSNSYLNSISDNLSRSYFVGFSNSETWLTFELAAKAVMLENGFPKEHLRKKIGHDQEKLLNELEKFFPKDILKEVKNIVSVLPDYTSSRFDPNESSRIDVITQASASQLGVALCAELLPSKLDGLSAFG